MSPLWLLTLILVIAKLFNLIHWSWLLVFLPALLSMTIGLVFLGGLFAMAVLSVYLGK